jgi:hypothetical protein
MKTKIALSIVCTILGFYSYRVNQLNQVLQLNNTLYIAEHRILKDEITELSNRPTYEQGCKDTLIKMGANGSEGFNNGYDAAVSILANSSYADGYHNCIQQFSYQLPNTQRYLVPEPKESTAKVGLK